MKMNSTKLLTALLFISFFSSKAQQVIHDGHNHGHIDEFRLPLEFDKDSLKGFNEEAAWQQARINADDEWAQKRLVAILKRSFIDYKYTLVARAPLPTVQQPCTNPDFENGTIAGWAASQGSYTNSATMGGFTPGATTQIITVAPGNDPNLGAALPTVPSGGGNYAARLGPTGASSGGVLYRLSQTFTVTPANAVFIYKYAVVLNKAPHTCTEQPFFNVSFKDCSNNPIPCGAYNVTSAGSSCSSGGDPSFNTSNATWAYKPWTTAAFDLSAYIGQCVKIEFSVAGCVTQQGAHGGYAYVDASCAPMTLNLNGTDIPIGQTTSASCGAVSNNTLCAPPGFSYNWSGPGVTGQTGQCINAAVAGTYSVTLGVAGASCAFNPILYSNFTYSPNPIVTSSVIQPVCANPAGSATVTASGGTGNYTYSWTPTAPSGSVNINLPTNTLYTVTATDVNGCHGNTTFSINPYPPAPAYTLATVPGLVLSCQNPTINLTFAPTSTNTSTQWSGPSGPITGTTSIATNAGVYTYTAINTVSTCSLTGTINITGVIVLPVLTSTLTQPTCTLPVGTASVSTTGVGPFTYTWTSAVGQPTVGLPHYTDNTNLPPGTSYTVQVTDPSGCIGSTTLAINPFSGAAAYNLTNNPGGPLTCPSPSTTISFSPGNANTTTTWEGPFGPITGTTTVATQSGVYSYTATNSMSGCTVTGTVAVTSNIAAPAATLAVVCNTVGIHLDAVSTSPDNTLSWAGPTSTVSLGNPVNSTAVGVFTLTVTDPLNGCVSTYTAVSGYPSVSISTAPNTNSITCINQSIQANATASPANANVSWSNGTNTVTTNPYAITSAGTYTAFVQVPNGCATQSVITIGSNTNADVSINLLSNVIPCSTGSLAITATSSSGSGPYTYSWTPANPSFTGNPFIATTAGNYTVTAINNANGCSATATQAVTQETIDASFHADPTRGLMPLTVTFTNTSTNATGYSWNFGNSSTSTSTNTSTVYNEQGTFTVVLTATNGSCTDRDTAYIVVDLVSAFTVPNVFTPNGDGKNDMFKLHAVNMGEIHMVIFDRWGLKMFESTDTGKMEWDGKTKGGSLVTDGTYFYIIHATGLDDQKFEFKGSLSVFQ